MWALHSTNPHWRAKRRNDFFGIASNRAPKSSSFSSVVSRRKLPKSYHLTLSSPPKLHYKVFQPSLICNIQTDILGIFSNFLHFLKEFKYFSTTVSETLASGTIWATGFLNPTVSCLNRTSTWNISEKLCFLKVRHYRRPFRSFGAWILIIFTGPLSGAGN
jgi:hypothetical protein